MAPVETGTQLRKTTVYWVKTDIFHKALIY